MAAQQRAPVLVETGDPSAQRAVALAVKVVALRLAARRARQQMRVRGAHPRAEAKPTEASPGLAKQELLPAWISVRGWSRNP